MHHFYKYKCCITVFETLYAKGKDTRALAGVKILPIGQATASATRIEGYNSGLHAEHIYL